MAEDSKTDEDGEGLEEDDQALNNKVNQWMRGVPTSEPDQIPQRGAQQRQDLPLQITVQQNQLPSQPVVRQEQLQPHPQQNHLLLQPVVQSNQLPCQIIPELRQMRIDVSTQLPSRIENHGGHSSGFNPAQRSTPRQMAVEDDGLNLSRSQVAARQAVSRELPLFSGTPEEWPLFYSSFITTTNMCGYTPEENLSRGNLEVIVHNLIALIKTTPPPKSERLDTLIEFSVAVQNLCATIEACQLDEYSYNVVLLRELVDKLPSSFKVDWAKYRRTLSCVNLTTFSVWLCDLAETVCPIDALPRFDSKAAVGKKDQAYLNAHTEEEDTERSETNQSVKSSSSNPRSQTCLVCKCCCPSVDKCARFAELSYNSRWATVKELGLCRKCLKKHKASCKSHQVCGKNGCQFKHHQLLHNNHRDNSTNANASRQEPSPIATVQSTADRECNTHLKSTNKTLFRVVPVFLYGPERTVKTYAFLDDGSSLTLMDSDLATELRLSGKAVPLCLRWTSNKSRFENDSLQLDIEISGIEKNHKKYRSVNVNELAYQYPYLRGIPVESYHDVQLRILIGIDNANLTLPLKGREGKLCQPIATKTRLGWIIHGGTESSEELVGYLSAKVFLRWDERCDTPECVSTEDQRAENILKTITQDESGHYVTRLLWKYDDFRLPNSKPMALQRLRCLESRLKKDPEVAVVVRKQIGEYLEKGYIRKLSKKELSEKKKRVWYLPIFPVLNPNKPGKVRIVWDAAAKTNGVSLNSMLLIGPDQMTSLVSVLIQFRENKVAICGDLREMFHQVRISMDDQDCQRFLWRYNSTDLEPSTYVMQVMTFGACCSPSCAQYIKNMNAEKHAGQYPAAAKAIIKNHYVDDMLASTETEDEAIQLARDVRHVHAQAGFEMRNWISNSPAVLTALHNESIDDKSLNLGSELATEKILGMWWCTAMDILTFKLSPKHDNVLLSGKRRPTKREVLRTLMAIFDPLGFLSHLLIFLKVLLQEIWRSGISWDQEIPENINEKWERWLKVLPSVRDVRIPRCYRLLTSIGLKTDVQIHTFVDASEDGYAAVVYLRFQRGSVVECAIVVAKSRVAPLKFVSIPRLELQAAVVGARLANTVTSSLSFKVNKKFFWTDSRDVLCWIRSDHRRYSQFVAFRVSDILETSEIPDWKWVGTKDNVADEATKWQRLPDLRSESRWFKGPEFLWQKDDNWPVEPFTTGSTKQEIRAHLLHHDTVVESLINVEHFSNWKRLVRTIAFVFRFLRNSRSKRSMIQRECGSLSSTELQQASNFLFKDAQKNHFLRKSAFFRVATAQ
ncbi:uncharacterized protein LOC129766279 [Toxorhynchites rutilus septentrionalis]|uniref:uncharacterized protein LOC129766279 n=1 Tax=Toxorhynchites rutilus septentrionalis TaxID=329112 RepID=UPI00247996C4|nr:uncharacterized protein LOC129766279 [Toxorhynchites rutilus septentrionalis]